MKKVFILLAAAALVAATTACGNRNQNGNDAATEIEAIETTLEETPAVVEEAAVAADSVETPAEEVIVQ